MDEVSHIYIAITIVFFVLLILAIYSTTMYFKRDNEVKDLKVDKLRLIKRNDYLEIHQSTLIGEMNVYKNKIEELTKELNELNLEEPDEILYKIVTPDTLFRYSNTEPTLPDEIISVTYYGYRVNKANVKSSEDISAEIDKLTKDFIESLMVFKQPIEPQRHLLNGNLFKLIGQIT